MSAVEPLRTEIRKVEPNCSGARDLKNHVLGVQYSLFFASRVAPLSTRKRVISRFPFLEDNMSAVIPLITEIRKIEPNCSGARDLKNHVLGV